MASSYYLIIYSHIPEPWLCTGLESNYRLTFFLIILFRFLEKQSDVVTLSTLHIAAMLVNEWLPHALNVAKRTAAAALSSA